MRLKLMWDYDAFPVWQVDGLGGMLAPEALRLSAGLTGDLQRWSDDWTAAMWGDKGPDASGWAPPPTETWAAWDRRGRRLLTRLRPELPRDWVVGYMNESSGEIEWPA